MTLEELLAIPLCDIPDIPFALTAEKDKLLKSGDAVLKEEERARLMVTGYKDAGDIAYVR